MYNGGRRRRIVRLVRVLAEDEPPWFAEIVLSCGHRQRTQRLDLTMAHCGERMKLHHWKPIGR